MNKAYTGPICDLKEWETKRIPGMIKEKLKKFDLAKTFDAENPINMDDELADRFYEAGYELALEMGLLCTDTNRIIDIEKEELDEMLKNKPNSIKAGSGDDEINIRCRKPEDEIVPMVESSLALVLDEELYILFVEEIIKHRKLVDILNGPSMVTLHGNTVRSGTPMETLLGRYEAELRHEAMFRASRPGMANTAIQSAVTHYGQLGGGAFIGGPGNFTKCLIPVELKVDFAAFHKMAMAENCNSKLVIGATSQIGGYAGPTEGAALANIATDLLVNTLFANDITSTTIYDLNLLGNCGRKAIWANSIKLQAITRNTNIMINCIVNETAGPMTEMFFYEAAVGLINHCVSGTTTSLGPRSAGGRLSNYITPMEVKWMAEVFKSAAGMNREEANRIIKPLLAKYEDRLKTPPDGQSIYECYDVKTMTPSEEYVAFYKVMKQELLDLGFDINKVYEN